MYLHFMQFSTTTYVISFPLNLGGIVIRPFGPAYADCSSYVGRRGSTTNSYPVFQELIATPGALRTASSGRLSPCVATPISRPTRTRSPFPFPKVWRRFWSAWALSARPRVLNEGASTSRGLVVDARGPRAFPRDVRGRLLLRRDHLDAYLPGTFCRSNSSAPLLICNDTDDPWPLTPDDGSVRAFYAASRDFLYLEHSPASEKSRTFLRSIRRPRFRDRVYALWVLAAADGSLHLVDGMTDQVIRGAKWGSDLAAVRSPCGTGTQLLVSESGNLTSGNSQSATACVRSRSPIATQWLPVQR